MTMRSTVVVVIAFLSSTRLKEQRVVIKSVPSRPQFELNLNHVHVDARLFALTTENCRQQGNKLDCYATACLKIIGLNYIARNIVKPFI